MANPANRRDFIKTAGAAGIGFYLTAGVRGEEKKLAPSDKIRLASIGIGGKGSGDAANAVKHGTMVAFCDIDTQRIDSAKKRYTSAKTYTDFRKLLEENEDKIDAVTVSTPDHTHAAAALMAMRMGKAVFCQKPLTHSIYEARLMGEVAREQGVVTQMGNQGTTHDPLREAAAIIKSGQLGQAKEVHVWTNRPRWPQGGPGPKPTKCPEHIKWNDWLGPAKRRPYGNGYQPSSWRGFWDFGTGALGDMACHTMNMPFMGLDLRDPIAITADTSGHNKIYYSSSTKITYEFDKRGNRDPLKMYWYDGGRLPRIYTKLWKTISNVWKAGKERETLAELAAPWSHTKEEKYAQAIKAYEGTARADTGSMIIFDDVTLLSSYSYGRAFVLLKNITRDSADFMPKPKVDFVRAPGEQNVTEFDTRLMTEWINAIRGNGTAVSNFPDYASPLTETVLLGNLATWADGPRVEWDAANMKSPNMPELEQIIKPTYENGYILDV
jgi:predicted dehydrogenase